MKIQFSRDFGDIDVAVDPDNYEQDAAKCKLLEKLFNSEEWVVLLELMAQAEDKLHQAAMRVKPQEQSFREGAIYSARDNGFTQAMLLLGKAVKSYQEERAKRKKAVEDQVDSILGQTQEEVVYNE